MFWRKKPKPAPEPILSDLEQIVLEMGRIRANVRIEYDYKITGSFGGFEVYFDSCNDVLRATFEGVRVDLTTSERKLIRDTFGKILRDTANEKQALIRSSLATIPLELQKANEQKLLTELAECRARIKASEGA